MSKGLGTGTLAARIAAALVVLALQAPFHGQGATRARLGEREVVEFKLAHAVTDPQEAVFVLGSLAELGGSELARSVQLVSADDTRWRVAVSLPADRAYSYQFWLRSARAADLGDPSNGVALTPMLRGKTAPSRNGPGSKALQVHTRLVDPVLHWRQEGWPTAGDPPGFTSQPLELLGAGRTPDEQRFGQRGFGVGKRPVEFFLTSSDGSQRDPAEPSTTYVTPLDAFFLQDGELFTYVPAPVVGPTRLISTSPLTIQSLVLGRERHYRVRLPRGYDEHPERRYPVLYLYDGQHVWAPGPYSAQFGVWDQDGAHAAALVARGEAGEILQVAIDYVEEDPLCDVGISRGRDCLSPEDRVNEGPLCGRVRGQADRFLLFVTQELKPLVDATFRTLPDRAHTFAAGYSYGGVFALYAGWEFTDTFAAIAAQSGSFWVPNFTARVMLERRSDLRIYLDLGDLEIPDITGPNARLREAFLSSHGRVLERDLRFVVGFGDGHSFESGGRRLASTLSFLWPGTNEAPSLPW